MNVLNRSKYFAVVAALMLAMSGCTGGSESLAALKSRELSAQSRKCSRIESPSPGTIISCQNIKRECEKRSAEFGYPLC